MSFPYPPKPWSDGQEVRQLQSDGTLITATYRAEDNVWDMVRTNPDAGDEGYITDQQVLLLPRVDNEGGEPLNYTAAFAGLNDEEERPVFNQFQFNDESFYSLFNQKRKQTRARTTTDFIQSTVAEGEWILDAEYVENELPDIGEFNLFDASGSPVNEWITVSKILINGTGRNTESLSDVRRGSVINFFDVILNSFAQYVVQNVEVIGSIEGGMFWLELDVAAVYGRAAGSIPPGTVAEIQVIQNRPCIVSSTSAPPLVNNSGFLWYSEFSRKLYVSNWSSINGPNGHSSWTASDLSEVIKTVTYYESPQSVTSQDGAVGGSGTNWFLSPQAIYIKVGDRVEIADEEVAYVVSFEQKDDATYPYTAMVLDRSITPPVADGEITHVHLPYEDSGDGLDGGGVVNLGDTPPDEADNGDLWFCTKEDDLSMYINIGTDLDPIWVPSSPPVSLDGVAGDIANIDAQVATVRADLFEVDNDLKSTQGTVGELTDAVDSNSRELTSLRSRIGTNEVEINKRAKKDGDTFYGNIDFAAKNDGQYFISLRAMRPVAWDTAQQNHGLILDIGNTNSSKQQFKIKGRSSRELFKIYDDGSANATLSGKLNATEALKVNGKDVATEEYVDAAVQSAIVSSRVPYQKFYANSTGSTTVYADKQIRWRNTGDEATMSISVNTYDEPITRTFSFPDTEERAYVVDFAMHRVGDKQSDHTDWQMIMAGKTKTIRFLTRSGLRYIRITYDISSCLVHRPEEFVNSNDDTADNETNYVNFQLGNILRY